MRCTALVSFVLAAAASGCTPGDSSAQALVAYSGTLAPALETARREKRPVFLNFGGPW